MAGGRRRWPLAQNAALAFDAAYGCGDKQSMGVLDKDKAFARQTAAMSAKHLVI